MIGNAKNKAVPEPVEGAGVIFPPAAKEAAKAIVSISGMMMRDVNCPNCGKTLKGPRGKAAMHCKLCGARWVTQ